MTKAPLGGSRGVSLPELLAGLAVIGLVLTFATPSYFRVHRRRVLRHETRTVYQFLRLARSRAIASRTFVAVEFDLQQYPTPDRIRILESAEWNAAAGRWIGDDMPGMMPHVPAVPVDVRAVGVGATTYLTGVHSIVFSATGSAAMDDNSITGTLDIDIVTADPAA